jgi:peptidoglycan/LPS O-acetylase OafA/YrhL
MQLNSIMDRDTATVAPNRMPQLDGLRAVAVGCVMLAHFKPDSFISLYVPLDLGVELFFVLSGFLITGILLRGTPTPGFILSFYIRRALRLFPLYYLVLGGLLIASHEVRAAWVYYAFYGINFWVAENQRWGVATHFWSLAVEEQFYLIWPFCVLLLPRRTLLLFCIALIVAAPVFRLAMIVIWDNPLAGLLLPGCIDQLACGALLALTRFPQLSVRQVFIGAISAAAATTCGWPAVDGVVAGTTRWSLALPFFYILVGAAARGVSGPVGQALSHPVIRYLGRISYGIYVLHFIVLGAIMPYLSKVNPYLGGVIFGLITVALSAVSWHFYETPINRARGRVVGAFMRRFGLAVPAGAD